MDTITRLNVLNTPVDALDMERALAFVEQRLTTDEPPGYILAVNPEKVYSVGPDPELRRLFQGATLLLPDGIGVVAAMHLLFGADAHRVPGADLMQQLCA